MLARYKRFQYDSYEKIVHSIGIVSLNVHWAWSGKETNIPDTSTMARSKKNIGENKDLIIRFVLASHPPISSFGTIACTLCAFFCLCREFSFDVPRCGAWERANVRTQPVTVRMWLANLICHRANIVRERGPRILIFVQYPRSNVPPCRRIDVFYLFSVIMFKCLRADEDF